MKTSSRLKNLAVLSSLVALASCGGSGGGSSGSSSSAPSTLESLPAATGPVVSTGSSLLASARKAKRTSDRILQYATANTGVVLNNADGTTFGNASNSTAFCEVTNMVKNIFREASTPDKILCYMAAMKANGVLTDSIYNGNWNYFKLINVPGGDDGNPTPYIKTRILKQNGAISDFKMYSCFSGTTMAPEQSEYISQTFSSTTATVVAKNTGSDSLSGDTYGSTVSASGTVDGSGEWTDKTLEASNYWRNGAQENNQSMTLTQGPASISLEGYQKGDWASGTFEGTYSNAFVAFVETLNNGNLTTLALGNGSARVNISNTFDDTSDGDPSASQTMTGYESWNGDDKDALADEATGDYYSEVESVTLPTVPGTVAAISFSGDEAWDCQADGSFTDADLADGGTGLVEDMQACEETFGLEDSWVDCSATYH